jgi:hypothetical protein
MKRLFYLLPLLVLLQSACTPYYASITPPAVVTWTVTPIETSPTSSPTLTPESNATLTPRPTLGPEAAQDLVLDLIETNGGCRLPCWWGITPGQTTWEDARAFLGTFVSRIAVLPPDFYGVTYDDLPPDVSEGAVAATISVQDGIVQTIRTDTYLPMAEMLNSYGEPSEIWIFADRQSIDPDAPFMIALFYGDAGILSVYKGSTPKADPLDVCPNQIDGPQQIWFLWNPRLGFSFEQAGPNALLFRGRPSERPFFQLEEVTNINTKMFFEMDRDPANTAECFEFSAG